MSLVGVSVAYGAQVVLDDIGLAVAPGECVAIMGPSGSGKTTLLNLVTGVATPDSGQVWVGEYDLPTLSDADRAAFRRTELGLVFQVPELLPELTVGENVAITRIFDGVVRRQALAEAASSLASVGLEGYGPVGTAILSGGEAQRVAVARALCRADVGLLVADEPTASLDRTTADRVAELLLTRARSRGITVLVATHDPLVAHQCDRTITVDMSSPGMNAG